MITTADIGQSITVESVNVKDSDRFVVAHVATYSAADGTVSVRDAAAAALAMIYDADSDGTVWSVYDRHTGLTSFIDQSEFDELATRKGYIT